MYNSKYTSNPSINGRIFEYLIAETLVQEKIIPFYYQAKFLLVPNADFDIALYHPQNPVVLTMKTSLRERYKQADLEGMALRNVYRGCETYLITLSESESLNITGKIQDSSIGGLDGCIVASEPEYDEFLKGLQKKTFSVAEPIEPINSSSPPVSG